MKVENSRQKGIGGTDISAILGMNPHKTALDVWLSKTGQAPPDEDNENKWWGREMEPILAKRYTEETGIDLIVPHGPELPGVHPEFPWIIGSPDALHFVNGMIRYTPRPTLIKAEAGVDFKTSGRPQDWGEPGTDDVPRPYLIQAEWYMGLTGAQWWDIACLLMGFTRKFAIYRINRDDDLIGYFQEEAEKFWKDHVLTGTPPPLDGSKSASEYLKRKYPANLGPMLEPTDEDILIEINNYRETCKELKEMEEFVSKCENRLKAFIGDCAGMQGKWGKIYWKKNKDGQTLDYKAMAAAHPDIAAQFMKPQIGARVFRPYFKEEK